MELINKNCIEILTEFKADSFDLIVADRMGFYANESTKQMMKIIFE